MSSRGWRRVEQPDDKSEDSEDDVNISDGDESGADDALTASLEGAPGLGLGAGSPFGLLFTPGSAPPARASWSGGPARLRHAPPGFATPARPGRGRREEAGAGACGEAEAQPDRRLHAGLDAVVDKLRGRLSRCGPPARPEGRWGVVRSPFPFRPASRSRSD